MSDSSENNSIENANFDQRMDIAQKETELRDTSVLARHGKLKEGQERLKQQEVFSLSNRRVDHIRMEQKGRESSQYIEDSKKGLHFICDTFNRIVPFFRNNLIFISARTGEGKTTVTANVAKSIIDQGGKVLILTNEELEVDVYNRITSLCRGWHYINHNKIPDDRISIYEKSIPVLATRVTVIDDNDEEIPAATTTLEGVKCILDKALEEKNPDGSPFYSSVIIDYYQNIVSSDEFPSLNEYEVQRRFTDYIDSYRRKAPFPIVILSQLKDKGKGKNEIDFKSRIEGTKKIANRATCSLEIAADRKNRKTEWKVHKGRYNEMVGDSVYTGYDKGLFVEYTSEFKAIVDALNLDKELKDKRIKESTELMEQVEKADESGS